MSKTKQTLLIIVALLFAYFAFRYAWHYATVTYFKYRCDSYGGEFIYKAIDEVDGLFQMRLRDPQFLLDRLRKHEVPADPYGHTDWESQNPQTLFVDPLGGKYRFFETTKAPDTERPSLITRIPRNISATGERYWRYSMPETPDEAYLKVEQVSTLNSKYGFTWKEVRTLWDRMLGLWGGELIVVDLKTEEILGVRRGFFYLDKLNNKFGYCPDKTHSSAFDFISQVLRPRGNGPGVD